MQADHPGWRPCQGVPDWHPSGACNHRGHGAVPGPGRGPFPLLLLPWSCQTCLVCLGLGGSLHPTIPCSTGTVTSGTGDAVPHVVQWLLHTRQGPGFPHKGSSWFERDIPPHHLSFPDPQCLAGPRSTAQGQRPTHLMGTLQRWTGGNKQQPVDLCPVGSRSLLTPLPVPTEACTQPAGGSGACGTSQPMHNCPPWCVGVSVHCRAAWRCPLSRGLQVAFSAPNSPLALAHVASWAGGSATTGAHSHNSFGGNLGGNSHCHGEFGAQRQHPRNCCAGDQGGNAAGISSSAPSTAGG